jgi:hypothetical protein
MGRSNGSSTAELRALWILLLVVCMQLANGFPAIYVARYQKQCADHPASHFGKVHDYNSAVDK